MPTFVLMKFPNKLENKIQFRQEKKALRSLGVDNELIDFSSNDYLGFAKSEAIFNDTHQWMMDQKILKNGATGSRLLSGNHSLYTLVEKELTQFHQSESALIFNSGYDANVGFFSCVPQRGDIILYDELIHASIRDGIQLSNAKAYKFKHNNLYDLESLLARYSKTTANSNNEMYVVTEAVFSMDGDMPNLKEMIALLKKYKAYFVVDEAHGLGVFGDNGCGNVQGLGLENEIFARIVTFGKGLGCHGAAVLGSKQLISYLVNFARSFIYTTGLSPHALATILTAYNYLTLEQVGFQNPQEKLKENIRFFIQEVKRLALKKRFIESTSAIHCCVISGNDAVKAIAQQMQKNGFDVKPILSPTVSEGEERLRFCLHAYNSKEEITNVLQNLSIFVNKLKQ